MKKKIKDLTSQEIGVLCIKQAKNIKPCDNCPLKTDFGCWNNVIDELEIFAENEVEVDE